LRRQGGKHRRRERTASFAIERGLDRRTFPRLALPSAAIGHGGVAIRLGDVEVSCAPSTMIVIVSKVCSTSMSEESTSAELPEGLGGIPLEGLGEIPLLDLLPISMQSHLKTPVPDQLWHYTSMNAMHSIVEHGEMYATDARFLNDREELIHAAEFADRLIQTQDYPPEVITFVRKHVASWFGVFLSFSNPFRNYVTCFTTHRDDLSQWRAYSGGSAGASIAIDLRDTALRPHPCIYKDEEKAVYLMDIFAEMFKVGEMHFKADPILLLPPDESLPADVEVKFPGAEMNVKGAAIRLLVPIMNIIPLFKNKAFSAESEWRVVTLASEYDMGSESKTPNGSLFYRARPDSLVPTMRVNIKRKDGSVPLNGLVLGPGSHPNATDAVTRFLRFKGSAVRAEVSGVPYRSTSS
jgi:hypothetical protein